MPKRAPCRKGYPPLKLLRWARAPACKNEAEVAWIRCEALATESQDFNLCSLATLLNADLCALAMTCVLCEQAQTKLAHKLAQAFHRSVRLYFRPTISASFSCLHKR